MMSLAALLARVDNQTYANHQPIHHEARDELAFDKRRKPSGAASGY